MIIIIIMYKSFILYYILYDYDILSAMARAFAFEPGVSFATITRRNPHPCGLSPRATVASGSF